MQDVPVRQKCEEKDGARMIPLPPFPLSRDALAKWLASFGLSTDTTLPMASSVLALVRAAAVEACDAGIVARSRDDTWNECIEKAIAAVVNP